MTFTKKIMVLTLGALISLAAVIVEVVHSALADNQEKIA